jgi:hypothetical protein
MTHDELAKMAYDNTVAFAAAPVPAEALKQAFDTHEIVFALFPDGSPRGWDKHIVKGKMLIAGATDEQIAALSITAVPCTDMEEAMAMEKTFGDGKLH